MNPRSSRTDRHARTVAPWVRTRLRTAPAAAVAFGVLVLLTAFLAAGFPRAVDAYENHGLRYDLTDASPSRSVLEVTTPQPPLQMPEPAREKSLRPKRLANVHRVVTGLLPEPLRVDAAQSAYGVETAKPLEGLDPWLPRPQGASPEFSLVAQSDLATHSAVREGRLPKTDGRVTSATKELEAAVTAETAKTLGIKRGSVLRLGQAPVLSVRITGIVEPSDPQASYWSAEPGLRTPRLLVAPGISPPVVYWNASLLIAPEAAPALLGTLGEPQPYWRFAPVAGHLTTHDVPALTDRIASLEGGPGLLGIKGAVDENASLATDLDGILASYTTMRDAITPVVAVAAFGIGTVAAVVMAMTGGLFAARRRAELALLRSRGGSLRGIGGRLLAETAVVALPAAATGLLLAVLVVDDDARLWPAVAGAGAVAVMACATLPVRAVTQHRSPHVPGDRDDVVLARPSRRRTVAELTLLVLAVGAVVALRRRGTSDGADHLVSAAPVLVGLIAALVLVRLYPLPLRWAARPVGRLRGAVGFLSLARTGRASAAGALPLLALLVALTTAAFGGSVLAGVADARDRAALLATGADARVFGPGDAVALPEGAERAVAGVPGVRDVTAVQIEHALTLPARDQADRSDPLAVSLVGADPGAYARLARDSGLGGFPADALRTAPGDDSGSGPVLHAVASPGVAEQLGKKTHRIDSIAGAFTVRVAAVRSRTPAVSSREFLVVDGSRLTHRAPTALLATGSGIDGKALRAAVHGMDDDLTVRLRDEARAAFTDSPLQSGAERIYVAAIAAGAGYAVLALLLSLMQAAPERATLLARLRTMGLTTRQGGQLLGLEALPQALLAAGGGVFVGWATIQLLAPGVDLVRLALAAAPDLAPVDSASLRADPWSLAVPAAAVVLLAGAVVAVQAWWAGRRGSITELRAGDTR
ncbi:ABC transporter permease [Streptomyces peucetius]|uniref:ABC transporter permease n=1 Tax=Streptomyces peucetius TaxID=1950 RepID=A0ABY6I608_STRPE|nr:ABC transporter permease [Streptomyces peucetius]UYQ62169.1 ABC transporter permease [Streptomyces peucetius]